MTTITITIPNQVTTRVIDGFCKRFNYSTTLEDGEPNPETKAQFAQRKIREFIKQAVREAEMETAKNAAAETAANSVENDIILT